MVALGAFGRSSVRMAVFSSGVGARLPGPATVVGAPVVEGAVDAGNEGSVAGAVVAVTPALVVGPATVGALFVFLSCVNKMTSATTRASATRPAATIHGVAFRRGGGSGGGGGGGGGG